MRPLTGLCNMPYTTRLAFMQLQQHISAEALTAQCTANQPDLLDVIVAVVAVCACFLARRSDAAHSIGLHPCVSGVRSHHFHYGYFMYAAAALGRHDAAWLAANAVSC